MFQFFNDIVSRTTDSDNLLPLPTHCVLQLGDGMWSKAPVCARRRLWHVAIRAYLPPPRLSKLLGHALPDDVTSVIARDVPRSFPEYEYFQCQDGKLHLTQLLQAYAACDPGVGYCQGLNFLAGCILLYCPDAEEAFQILYTLLIHQGMRELYTPDLKVLQSSMDNVMGNLPSTLQSHFFNCGVVRSMFLPSWLMTVFSADFHISVTGRLLDVMLVEGWQRALLATATTCITLSQPWLEQMKRMESVVDVLKNQLPALPAAKHHQIITAALSQAWSDSRKWSPVGTGAQPATVPTVRRHSLMQGTPLSHSSRPGSMRRATADISLSRRQRAGSHGAGSPGALPMSFTAHQASAMKQRFDNLLDVYGEKAQFASSRSLVQVAELLADGTVQEQAATTSEC